MTLEDWALIRRGFKADIVERYRAGDRSIGQVAPYPDHTSRLATVLVAVITSNTALATMPGNVFMPARRPACAGTAPPSRSDEVGGASITCATCRRHRPSRGIPRGPDIAPLPIG